MWILIWWHLFIALIARCIAQENSWTTCQEEACQCDSFTRVICNCTAEHDNITFRPDGPFRVPETATAIIVNGCTQITFLSNTIKNLISLRRIELRNVQNVYINEHALAWSPFSRENELNPGVRIIIQNSTISELAPHAIQGRIDDILISKSKFKWIKPFAFTSLLDVKNIELTDNSFETIDIQAFKKFTTLNFLLRGGSIKTLPSRFLSDVEVTNLFRIDGVRVDTLLSSTFRVNSPKRVLIENNQIGVLEGDAFHIETRGPITFRNNTIGSIRKGAFYGFTVAPEVRSISGPLELLIDNNTVSSLLPSSLMYNQSSLTLRVDGLNYNISCSCSLGDQWLQTLKDLGAYMSCWYSLESHYVTLPTYMDMRCGAYKQNFWIFIVIVVVIVVIIAAGITFYLVRRENEKKKKVQIVMPDGKTYRETEFHIIVERAELLTTDL